MSRLRRVVPVVMVVVSATVVVRAQSPRPTFEVASVRTRTAPGPTTITGGQGAAPGGVFRMVNTTVARLVMYGYDLPDYRVIGGADWVRADRFDVEARAGREVSLPEMRLMVQSLLAERFRLVAHTEQRQMPIYALVLARTDGRLGSNLISNDNQCASVVPRPQNVPPGAAVSTGCGTLSRFAVAASQVMGAPVIDKTGLVGNFEYAFFFQPRTVGLRGGPNVTADTNLPDYPTALREQLGLRLDGARAAVDVLVIDSVSAPTPN